MVYALEDDIRLAAFKFLEEKTKYDEIVSWQVLTQGFDYKGQRITLAGLKGIWKPKVFKTIPLSITTSPKGPYKDVITNDGFLVYKYRGTDPYHKDNVGLREAMRNRVPLIYFHGISPGNYLAFWPVFIVDDSPANLSFLVAVDDSRVLSMGSLSETPLSTPDSELYRRKYNTFLARQRLHQASFRVRVLNAYREQCAFCALKHVELLDAAHILPDSHEKGDPIVPNGLSLCKIHHAAFDKNLIGVNPDYRIIVREDVLYETDGLMLQYGIQQLHNKSIILPKNREEKPDRERLAIRFEEFKNAI